MYQDIELEYQKFRGCSNCTVQLDQRSFPILDLRAVYGCILMFVDVCDLKCKASFVYCDECRVPWLLRLQSLRPKVMRLPHLSRLFEIPLFGSSTTIPDDLERFPADKLKIKSYACYSIMFFNIYFYILT